MKSPIIDQKKLYSVNILESYKSKTTDKNLEKNNKKLTHFFEKLNPKHLKIRVNFKINYKGENNEDVLETK